VLTATAGLAMFLWASHPLSVRQWLARSPVGLGAAAVSTVALSIVFRLGVGQWPFATLGAAASPLTKFLIGYSGLALKFDWVPFTLFCMSAFAAASAALSHRRRQGSFPVAFQLGAAVTALIWGAYYVNRPSRVNLVTYVMLFGLILLPSLRSRALRSAARLSRRGLAPAGILLFAATVGAGSAQLGGDVLGMRDALAAVQGLPGQEIDGAWVSPPDALLIEAKAGALASEPRDSVYTLTMNSVFVPHLTGVQNGLPFGDTLLEVVTLDDFERLVERILSTPRAKVFIDDPSHHHTSFHQSLYARVRERIGSSYRKAEVRDGWEIWQRR
jgi:hypothetical protein